MESTEKALSFTSVHEEHALLLAAGGQLLFAVLVDWEWISLESAFAPVLPAIFATLIVRELVKTLQRVQFNGSTVRVLDVTSWYRWRGFDLAEVQRIEYCQAPSDKGGAYLKLCLKPSSHRRWDTVRLVRVGLSGDGRLLAALRARLQALRPDLEVHKLPSHYRDGPGPASKPAKAARKSARRRKPPKAGRATRPEAAATTCNEAEIESFFDSRSDDDD
ncbi:hypothetical protein G4G28_11465 [Massilia sp. Dwa41.01b]|uniref:hypothetical protein n=1 Tax=unclassified Massilia TaxID=2609279 RepID=UPI0016005EB0|nr:MULTISPECIES: hypothetical protein [unclassified Massilia]QNA88952.1 hypothetical protein G4G28_11465 [Massilia sp. Dwa41.01b]QNA99840.1 hypothetical protein G4G31_15100 [Massilia sp. Se16.2.3]